jgi:murein DD-endopeptidase MepM/ murein hydrolase activator NlpD
MPYQRKEVKTERVKGKIASSLYESILRIGEKGELAVRFAEILEWDIDFWSDVQTEDSFQILVEKVYVDSKPVRYGKIYLVNYSGKIGNFYGINFNGNYYDREGKSLRRAFLKSPLRYSYISSYFSRARFHPILRVIRPHRGVDYVAPTGTPVSALGAGTVTFAGWRGGYGKLVVIRHPNGYVTKYGHLSRIRKGIYPGKNVRQGELIGYVGATGLATGPHLHFEVLKDNSWVNPLKLSSPPQEPVPPESMAHFIAFRDSLLKLVER